MNKTRELTTTAIFISLMCVIAPMSIPIGTVSLSLATLVIMLSVYILGTRDSVIACAVYLILGAVGLPVFSGFSGGIGRIIGPTGGYLLGYLLLAAVPGVFIRRDASRWNAALGFAAGTLVLYFVGTLWLSVTMRMPAGVALLAGVVPFIPGDALKIAAAVWLAPIIKSRISH